MGAVYKETYTKPLPPGAEIITRKGQRIARWKDKAGKTRTAPVTVGKDGTERITVTASTYTAKYRDGGGLVQKVTTGCRDETAARRVLADLERRAELVKAGVVTAAEDSVADHQGSPIGGHFDAYLMSLEAEGTCDEHRANVCRCLNRIAADCGFARLADLRREPLERWMVAQAKAGMGARTRNVYRAAAVAFCNWCVDGDPPRLVANPLVKTPKADEDGDTRRQRRSLTEDELRRVLYVARLRPLAEYGRATVRREQDDLPQNKRSRRTWQRAPLTLDGIAEAAERARDRLKSNPTFSADLEQRGRERALIYKTAVLTGLRRGELESLTVGHLDLDADPPYLTLTAADEKNRQGNSLPLRADLAAELRDWLNDKAAAFQDAPSDTPTLSFDSEAAKLRKPATSDSGRGKRQSCQGWTGLPPDTPVFRVPRQLVKRLDLDLQAASIPKLDSRGWSVDVHALRHTYGTLLSKSGAAPRTAQAAMRHSTIDLTMNTYTDPKLLDIQGAIDLLPDFPLDASYTATESKSGIATGTSGSDCSLVPTLVPELGRNADEPRLTCVSSPSLAIDASGDDFAVSPCPVKRKQPLSILDNGLHQERAKGFEPSTSSLGS